MKVTIEPVPEGTQEEIIIRCHTIGDEVQRLISLLESPSHKLLGDVDKEMHILDPDKVYYVESVDNKVFIYADAQVYESRKKLYELESELDSHDFFRSSKSMILNINKIESVKPTFDGRLEALLKNNERVFISRKYVSVLKSKLGL